MKELKDLVENGFSRLGKLVTPEQAKVLINDSERVLRQRLDDGHFVGSQSNVLLYEPFFESKSFMDILLIKKINQILQVAMDSDFTLMHYASGNRSLSALNIDKQDGSAHTQNRVSDVAADGWHVDSRYNNNRRLGDGFSFILIIALDEFRERNATQIVPKSHLIRDRPKRDGDYNYEVLNLEPGEAVLLDSGLWHRGGVPLNESRWGLHLFFAPWFVKPYYDYVKRGLPEFAQQYSASEVEIIKKLLHYYSTPPLHDKYRIKTVQSFTYPND